MWGTNCYHYNCIIWKIVIIQNFSIQSCKVNIQTRDGNTKHENLVFRVYRIKHENFKSKHETNTKKEETRNKHEKFENLHIALDFEVLSFSTAFSPIHIETLMLVS